MNSRMVKLPNGNIVRLGEHDRIEVDVFVELSEVIDTDLEGFLDLLSERATGSGLLGDISYRMAGNDHNALKVKVSGEIGLIEADEVEFESLPPREFEVTRS